jgi:predicted nucleic acid-binding protein
VIYTLDTNVLVDALRQPVELDRLKAFSSWVLPTTVLSSVVVVALKCQARESGWTIITRDGDFAAIRRSVTGLEVAAPFPGRS